MARVTSLFSLQGKFLRRHKIPKDDDGNCYTYKV